jgi:electron transfer flavoprotein beta subunit
MSVLVCWKWVAPEGDDRYGGVSAADQAALEVGLTLAGDRPVAVVIVGPPAADRALRDALARGARRAVRVSAPPDLRSEAVAASIVPFATGCEWVVCGDASVDRGSAAVPALVAAGCGYAQALGLVEVGPAAAGLRVLRRLDGGRREELALRAPAVLSVEGSVARLRRASLKAELAARTAPIEVVDGPDGPREMPVDAGPYRPRARVLPAPAGTDPLTRIRALTAAGSDVAHGEVVTLDPPAAAARILDALREWGYLPDEPGDGER